MASVDRQLWLLVVGAQCLVLDALYFVLCSKLKVPSAKCQVQSPKFKILFIPQCAHWVDAAGTPGRQQARDQGDAEQNGSHRAKSAQVESADSVQTGLHGATD